MSAERSAVPAVRLLHVTAGVLVLALLAVGCAKRPALTQASAPAPSGAALAPAAPAPAPASAPPEPSAAVGSTAPEPTPAPAPPAVLPAPKEFTSVAELRDIHFDFDRYNIRPGDAEILRTNAQWLRDHGDHLVLIEGHCDERGTNEYNQALGERRAKSTMSFLVSQGVKADRITVISYGEERPLCSEHNEACWSQNRRAHLLVKPQ